MRAGETALTLSLGLKRWPGARRVLGLSGLCWRPAALSAWAQDRGYRCVVGWGARPSGRLGRQVARRLGLPYLALEDGFLRSVGLGSEGAAPYSVSVDELGLYFDARAPSRLERLLNGQTLAPLPVPMSMPAPRLGFNDAAAFDLDDPRLLARAREGIAAIVAARLSKYNAAPERRLPPTRRPRVLVIDQCPGDAAISGALADAERFQQMLAVARAEHPTAEILIKLHPVVLAGRHHGHFSAADEDQRTRLLSLPWNPISLLRQVDQVYVVSSLMGLEALLVGVPVTCFGLPFYAGWGLTDDRVEAPRPRRRLRLEQLFAGAYLGYCRYLDPDTGEPCAAERVIEHLALQRRMFARNARRFIAYRFPLWKRRHLRRFLGSPDTQIAFVSGAKALEARARVMSLIKPRLRPARMPVLVWGARQPKRVLARARQLGCPIWRVEDGFLRSAGLGSDLSAPASWVFDQQGIYFDPRRPSDLERILSLTVFSPAELKRARLLRRMLIAARLSKYNVGNRSQSLDVSAAKGRRLLLVPGQVPGDASLRLGCRGLATNAELLARVRLEHPDAYILYKPHPDLMRGNRLGDRPPIDPRDYDQLLTKVGILPCLEVADEVHTLTSLVGFEALLRGLPVHTYGWPFYAGWGLTCDHQPWAARARALDLDALIAGVLLRYPRYLNPVTGEFTTPEQLIRLLSQELQMKTPAAAGSLLLRPLRLLPAFAVAVWHEGLLALRAGLGMRSSAAATAEPGWRRGLPALPAGLDRPSAGADGRLRSGE